MRENLVEASVVHPKGDAFKRTDTLVVKFDEKGNNDKETEIKHDDLVACAVYLKIGREEIFKVKVNKNNELYDPKKVGFRYSLGGNDIHNRFRFHEIEKTGFNQYVNYLKGRDDSVLAMAERHLK